MVGRALRQPFALKLVDDRDHRRMEATTATVNHQVMVDPQRVPGDHDLFMCGNDEQAKSEVRGLLESFGWPARSGDERERWVAKPSAAAATSARRAIVAECPPRPEFARHGRGP